MLRMSDLNQTKAPHRSPTAGSGLHVSHAMSLPIVPLIFRLHFVLPVKTTISVVLERVQWACRHNLIHSRP